MLLLILLLLLLHTFAAQLQDGIDAGSLQVAASTAVPPSDADRDRPITSQVRQTPHIDQHAYQLFQGLTFLFSGNYAISARFGRAVPARRVFRDPVLL